MLTTSQRAFNPFARRYSGLTLSKVYRTNENEKRRPYNNWVMSVDYATFTLLLFCSSGGMVLECQLFYKKLSSIIAHHRNETYSAAPFTSLSPQILVILITRSIVATSMISDSFLYALLSVNIKIFILKYV